MQTLKAKKLIATTLYYVALVPLVGITFFLALYLFGITWPAAFVVASLPVAKYEENINLDI